MSLVLYALKYAVYMCGADYVVCYVYSLDMVIRLIIANIASYSHAQAVLILCITHADQLYTLHLLTLKFMEFI